MDKRLKLQALLERISPNVYFQPPVNVQLTYPCILYVLSDMPTQEADNTPYKRHRTYQVTVIDYDPDSSIEKAVSELPFTSFDRFYTVDDLNHFIFSITMS